MLWAASAFLPSSTSKRLGPPRLGRHSTAQASSNKVWWPARPSNGRNIPVLAEERGADRPGPRRFAIIRRQPVHARPSSQLQIVVCILQSEIERPSRKELHSGARSVTITFTAHNPAFAFLPNLV